MLITKKKTLNVLPPTSSTIHSNLLWSHYFVYLSSNILDSCSKILEPAKYEWIIENGEIELRYLPYHQTSRKSVLVRKDVKRIVDVGGHSMHGVLRLYKLQKRIDFWNWFKAPDPRVRVKINVISFNEKLNTKIKNYVNFKKLFEESSRICLLSFQFLVSFGEKRRIKWPIIS